MGDGREGLVGEEGARPLLSLAGGGAAQLVGLEEGRVHVAG